MITLEPVHKALERMDVQGRELSLDTFNQIAGYVEKEEMAEAVKVMVAVFSEGILDARVIFYYVYAFFLDQGIQSFSGSFSLLTQILEAHFERLTPAQGAEKHFQKGLSLLMSQVLKRFRYSERSTKSGKSHSVIRQMTVTEFDQLMEGVACFTQVVQQKWKLASLEEGLLHLTKKLEEVRCLSVPEKEEPLFPIQEEVENLPEEVPEPRQQALRASFESPQMEVLLAKLTMFERLMEKNDYRKAALVSKDITRLIDDFDPSVYFPKVFSRYLSLLAKHVDALSEEWEKESSLQWGCLNKLYHADPDQFMTW